MNIPNLAWCHQRRRSSRVAASVFGPPELTAPPAVCDFVAAPASAFVASKLLLAVAHAAGLRRDSVFLEFPRNVEQERGGGSDPHPQQNVSSKNMLYPIPFQSRVRHPDDAR